MAEGIAKPLKPQPQEGCPLTCIDDPKVDVFITSADEHVIVDREAIPQSPWRPATALRQALLRCLECVIALDPLSFGPQSQVHQGPVSHLDSR